MSARRAAGAAPGRGTRWGRGRGRGRRRGGQGRALASRPGPGAEAGPCSVVQAPGPRGRAGGAVHGGGRGRGRPWVPARMSGRAPRAAPRPGRAACGPFSGAARPPFVCALCPAGAGAVGRRLRAGRALLRALRAPTRAWPAGASRPHPTPGGDPPVPPCSQRRARLASRTWGVSGGAWEARPAGGPVGERRPLNREVGVHSFPVGAGRGPCAPWAGWGCRRRPTRDSLSPSGMLPSIPASLPPEVSEDVKNYRKRRRRTRLPAWDRHPPAPRPSCGDDLGSSRCRRAPPSESLPPGCAGGQVTGPGASWRSGTRGTESRASPEGARWSRPDPLPPSPEAGPAPSQERVVPAGVGRRLVLLGQVSPRAPAPRLPPPWGLDMNNYTDAELCVG